MATQLIDTGWSGDSSGVWTRRADIVIDPDDGIDIASDATVNTLAGDDFIDGTFTASTLDSANTGIRNEGIVKTGTGNDTLKGTAATAVEDAEIDDNFLSVFEDIKDIINDSTEEDAVAGIKPDEVDPFLNSIEERIKLIEGIKSIIETNTPRETVSKNIKTVTVNNFTIGIDNTQGIVETGAGDDTVEGTTQTKANGTEVETTAIGIDNSQGIIKTNPGNDTVKGTAEAVAAGIKVLTFATGIDIFQSPIETDTGNDTIRGKAKATAEGSEVETIAVGIGNFGEIKTNAGNDIVRGEAEAIAEGTGDSDFPLVFPFATGIDNTQGLIETDPGDDIVEGVAKATAKGLDAFILTIGIDNTQGIIETGAGDDTTRGTAEATAESSEVDIVAIGIDNNQSLFTSAEAVSETKVGDDTVEGIAEATAESKEGFAKAESTGILNFREAARIQTGAGKDTVLGTAKSIAKSREDFAEAQAIGISNFGEINTGAGDDTINGIAEATTEGIESGTIAIGINDFGDFGGIQTGNGHDTVKGKADATEGNANAIGIRNAKVDLGRNDDIIIARATGTGINLGVDNVLLDGGKGKDTFDIQNGNGTIFGGAGEEDLLILEGSKDDYTFTEVSSLSLGVSITNAENFTDFVAGEVELFQFSGNPTVNYAYEAVVGLVMV